MTTPEIEWLCSEAKASEDEFIRASKDDGYFTPDECISMAKVMRRLHDGITALAAVAKERDAWAQSVLSATGGHATSPERAREVITRLRDMLDGLKKGTLPTPGRKLTAEEASKQLNEKCGDCMKRLVKDGD